MHTDALQVVETDSGVDDELRKGVKSTSSRPTDAGDTYEVSLLV